MIRTEAEGLIDFIDATWKMGLAADDYGHTRWLEFFESQEDATAMMVVLQKVAARQRDRVTISDVKKALIRLAPSPEAESEEFVREIPTWVKIWLVARANGDTRVLAEQERGYNFMQVDYPFGRTYVWPEQELMPDDARTKHAEAAMRLGADLHKVFTAAIS